VSQALRERGQSQSQPSPQKIPSALAVMPPTAQETLLAKMEPLQMVLKQQAQEKVLVLWQMQELLVQPA
jgi:hypothetical protein